MENNAGFYTYRGYELLRQEKLRLSPSMEDYLEMIYRTCKKQGYIRMTSLAQQLNGRPRRPQRRCKNLQK